MRNVQKRNTEVYYKSISKKVRITEKLPTSTCFYTLGLAAIISDVNTTTDIPCFSIYWSWSFIKTNVDITTSIMASFIIKSNAWNSKLLSDLVPAIVTIFHPVFILSILFICHRFRQNPNKTLTTSLTSANLVGRGSLLEISCYCRMVLLLKFVLCLIMLLLSSSPCSSANSSSMILLLSN